MTGDPYGFIPPVKRRRMWPAIALTLALTALLIALWFVYGPLGLVGRL